MNPKILFRIASVFFILFALGHTYGFLTFKPSTAEGRAAQEAMNKTTFPIGGSFLTLGGFYVGFGLSITVHLLFAAVLAWQLGSLAAAHARAILGISWAFFAAQLVGVVLVWPYFAVPQKVPGLVVAAILGWAAWLLKSSR